jgi:hypothetical protein
MGPKSSSRAENALHAAVKEGSWVSAQILLASKADPNSRFVVDTATAVATRLNHCLLLAALALWFGPELKQRQI